MVTYNRIKQTISLTKIPKYHTKIGHSADEDEVFFRTRNSVQLKSTGGRSL